MNAPSKPAQTSLRLVALVLVVAAVAGAAWWSSALAARASAGTYTLTPSAGAHGAISPATPQTVAVGSGMTFVMTPDIGFHVADVRVDDVSIGAPASYDFVDVQADHTISVTFARDVEGSFVIVASAGEHGIITPPVPVTVAAGGSAVFSIIPDAGYKVTDVLVDGVSVGAVTTYQFTSVQADHTLSATFEVDTKVYHTITPTPGAHGQITPPLAQTVAAGGAVTFEMVPDEGYHVADVVVDGTSVGARTSYEFTNVRADHTISAGFARDLVPTYTITAEPGLHGQILPPLAEAVPAGSSYTFTLVPDQGYHVTDVLVDGVSVGARGTYTFTDIRADHSISATFTQDAGPSVALTAPVGGEKWAAGSSQGIAWALSAAAAAGRFTVWAVPAAGQPVSLTPAQAPIAVEAGKTSYETTYTVALPAPAQYEVLVRLESPTGELLSESRSAGTVTVEPSVTITVTSPKAKAVWRRGSKKSVAWKLAADVVAGDFRVWAVSAAGKRTPVTPAAKPVAAQAGRTTYTAPWKVSVPAGKGYRILVEYWWSGAALATGRSTGTFSVTR
jgi:predicted ester cyclase